MVHNAANEGLSNPPEQNNRVLDESISLMIKIINEDTIGCSLNLKSYEGDKKEDKDLIINFIKYSKSESEYIKSKIFFMWKCN